ncbi:MAG: GDP-mannose 4,6-dehydratase [Candidatus Omnitrophota bacterium]
MKNIWKGKVIVITGANGFLGSHLVKRALAYNAKVVVLIKEDIARSLFNIGKLYRKVTVIRGDLKNRRLITSLFAKDKVSLCLHIAAQAIVGIANKSPLGTLRTNIEGTWNILEAARVYGVGAMIVASSDKAYGEHEKLPYKEDAPLLSLHPYDASKACADILSRTYAHTYAMPIGVSRCANIYGPGDFNFSRIIPDTMKAVINGKNPVIRSDGTPLRDYVFIDDIVDAYYNLARMLFLKKVGFGEAFNFGTGRAIRVLDLVYKIIKVSEKSGLSPRIMSKGKIKGEIEKQYLSSAKAKRLLGWEAKYNLDRGLKETYAYYRDFFRK